ncbi:MAG: hypothetical protein RI907_125 [Pseudomonadota bacterium]|jgi:hypothetical protein
MTVSDNLASANVRVEGKSRRLASEVTSYAGASSVIGANELSLNMTTAVGSTPATPLGPCFAPCNAGDYSFSGGTTWTLGFDVTTPTAVSVFGSTSSGAPGGSMSLGVKLYRLSAGGDVLLGEFAQLRALDRLDVGSYRLEASAWLDYSGGIQSGAAGAVNLRVFGAPASAVPETTSGALMGLGLLAIAAQRRRRIV